jgi:pimeloyl-ACP methyl ester carboxylesterase
MVKVRGLQLLLLSWTYLPFIANTVPQGLSKLSNSEHDTTTMMERKALRNWKIGEQSGLVDIGTHKLWLQASGPDRKDNCPVVIIIQGLASSARGWAAVHRLLTHTIRVFSYERSGYAESEASPDPPTSTIIAQELDLLLKSAGIEPPYILVAHSWGGILSREFLALRPPDVVGMVLVEANQEHTLEILDWRQPALAVMQVGVDGISATGLAHTNKLRPEEWQTYRAILSTSKFQEQAALEFAEYAKSFPILGAKAQLHRDPPLLGQLPVFVVKGDNRADLEKMFTAGVALGNGNATERAAYLEILRTWDVKDRGLQSRALSLSSTHRYSEAKKGAGHNVQLTHPESIVDAVEWVLANLEKGGFQEEPLLK